MLDRLDRIERRFKELEQQIAAPEIASDPKKLQTWAKDRASIEHIVTKYREYKATAKSLEETKTMQSGALDEDMMALVKQEIESLQLKLDQLNQEIKLALLPKDANDEKNVIVEIRAGTGGEEAGLFAADLFRMYSRYAQSKSWGVDVISVSESGIGAFKEIIFQIKGRGAVSRPK